MELPSHPVGSEGGGFEGHGSLKGRAVRRQLCSLERRGCGPGLELGTSDGVGRALLIRQGDVYSDCLGLPGDQSFLEMETQKRVRLKQRGLGKFRYDGACGSSRMETSVWLALKV